MDRAPHGDPRAPPPQRLRDAHRPRPRGLRRRAATTPAAPPPRSTTSSSRRSRPTASCPASRRKLAKLLGTNGAGAIDVNAACAGFLYGLDQTAALIESGRVNRALVVGAEALSRVTDPNDRGTAILFADGAAAVVVEAGEFEIGCSPFVLASDGEHGDLLYAERDERLLRMEGQEVYRHAVERMVEATREALRRADMTVDDVDVLIVHQANQRIIDAAARRLGVPEEKVFANVDDDRQHVERLDPAGAAPRRARRPPEARRHRRAGGVRRRLRVGRRHRQAGRNASMPVPDGGVALVTGGSRGIGAAIAERLKEDGLTVVTLGRTSGDVQADVGDSASVARRSPTCASASARCSCSSTTPASARTAWRSA